MESSVQKGLIYKIRLFDGISSENPLPKIGTKVVTGDTIVGNFIAPEGCYGRIETIILCRYPGSKEAKTETNDIEVVIVINQ